MPLRQLIDDSSIHMPQDGTQMSSSPAQNDCNNVFPQQERELQYKIPSTNTGHAHGNVLRCLIW